MKEGGGLCFALLVDTSSREHFDCTAIPLALPGEVGDAHEHETRRASLAEMTLSGEPCRHVHELRVADDGRWAWCVWCVVLAWPVLPLLLLPLARLHNRLVVVMVVVRGRRSGVTAAGGRRWESRMMPAEAVCRVERQGKRRYRGKGRDGERRGQGAVALHAKLVVVTHDEADGVKERGSGSDCE